MVLFVVPSATYRRRGMLELEKLTINRVDGTSIVIQYNTGLAFKKSMIIQN